MPKGISNAPATYNLLVTQSLKPHRGYAQAYFGDIFVHMETKTKLKEPTAILHSSSQCNSLTRRLNRRSCCVHALTCMKQNLSTAISHGCRLCRWLWADKSTIKSIRGSLCWWRDAVGLVNNIYEWHCRPLNHNLCVGDRPKALLKVKTYHAR